MRIVRGETVAPVEIVRTLRYSARMTRKLCLLLAASLPVFAQGPPPPPAEVAGIPVNYDEAKVGTYTLPDPLTLANGKKVTDAKTWNEKRRPEIVKLFEENQYGKTRKLLPESHFGVFEGPTPAFDGKAVR